MQAAEIIVRTQDSDDGLLIGNAIANGLTKLGFDNISNLIVGGDDNMQDPELLAAIERINPELVSTPVEVSWERQKPAGGVDAPPDDNDEDGPPDEDGPDPADD